MNFIIKKIIGLYFINLYPEKYNAFRCTSFSSGYQLTTKKKCVFAVTVVILKHFASSFWSLVPVLWVPFGGVVFVSKCMGTETALL